MTLSSFIKQKRRYLPALSVITSILMILLSASPILAALYTAPITVTESSGTAYTMLPIIMTAPNTYLAANGFMKSTALDTRVETVSGTAKPHLVTDNATLFATAVSANSQTNLQFSTGNTDLSAMSIITGYGGNITTTKNATLVAGATSCEIEWNGLIDTTKVNGVLTNCPYAGNNTYVYISATGQIKYSDAASGKTITLSGLNATVSDVKLTWNGTDILLTADGITNSTAQAITINAYWGYGDITWMSNNVSPYMNYIKYTRNGVAELLYQPNSIVLGTNLPNRSSSNYNGTFHWGSNPAGIAVTLGGVVPEALITTGTTADPTIPDTLPEVPVSDWYKEPDVSGTLVANPFRPFIRFLSDNSSLTEIQSWRVLTFAMIMMVTVWAAKISRGSRRITCIAAGMGVGGAVALTIFPLWALIFVIGFAIGGLVEERTPTL